MGKFYRMNVENVLLENCCSIRSGQTFKGRLDEYPPGTLTVLLPKDITDGTINENATKIDIGSVPQVARHRLKVGEIIIVNKGVRFSTYLYNETLPDVIATTAFYVITPGEHLLSEYLHWYLNQEEAKTYLSENVQGSVIPTITKNVLMQLSIPLISIKAQENICEFLKKSKVEMDLLKELILKKEAFNDSYIWEAITNSY